MRRVEYLNRNVLLKFTPVWTFDKPEASLSGVDGRAWVRVAGCGV